MMLGIISVIEKGNILADKIQDNLGGIVFKQSNNEKFCLNDITKECFKKYKYIVFISSTGIAVRAISKYLKSKEIDPAVIVVDTCNNFTISLVSGHLGGANALTNKISEILNNTPVITTATDNLGIEAPDIIAINNSLIIDDLKIAKVLASKLINNKVVYFKDDKNKIACPKSYTPIEEVINDMLWITNKVYVDKYYKGKSVKLKDALGLNISRIFKENNILKLVRRDVVLGIGCRRNTESKKLYDFVRESLIENNIDIRAVRIISSIDIKNDEEAILNLAKRLNVELKFFSKEEILAIEDKYEGSDFVKEAVGVKAVSEPVIELLGAKIVKHKIIKDGMTLSIGEGWNG